MHRKKGSISVAFSLNSKPKIQNNGIDVWKDENRLQNKIEGFGGRGWRKHNVGVRGANEPVLDHHNRQYRSFHDSSWFPTTGCIENHL
jgi:hypothetical protein